MHWSPYVLGTRRLLWFRHGCTGHALDTRTGLWLRTGLWSGHGCTGHRMFLVHEGYYGLGMDALVMLLMHERDHGLGMDALVTACSWNTNAPPPHPAPEVAESGGNSRKHQANYVHASAYMSCFKVV